VTWLHDDVDSLAAALTDAVARGDALDAFLAAAAMLQIAEDAMDGEPALLLHAAGRLASGGGWRGRGAAATARATARRAGDVAARRRPPAIRVWAGAVGEVVALLADRVAGTAGAAHARGCDLIVVGTHGKTGFEHLILGSVAEKMVRTSRFPLSN